MQRFVAIRGRYDRAARAQRVHEGCGTDGDGHRAETRKGARNQACERNEEKNFVQFLNSSINHVYKSGETIKIVFTPNSAITLNNNHEIDKFNFKKITAEQTTSDMKSFTNEFQIHINQKILTDSLQIIIKEDSNRKKLVLGINGVQIQQK